MTNPSGHSGMPASEPVAERERSRLVRLAGLAAEDRGGADHRPPLLLLHGLSFDHRIWGPALDELAGIDPGRRVLALDLPGHGESPARSAYDLESVAHDVRLAVEQAGLAAPVVVGHSIAGIIATIYAARYPTGGVVNVDQTLQVAPFAEMVQSLADKLRGPSFPAVWEMFAASMHSELLPVHAQALLRSISRPNQDLVLGYWQDVLNRPSAELAEWAATCLGEVRAKGVPYLVIAGDNPQPSYEHWLMEMLPQATTTVLPGSGHFPQLADPRRFAELLATTAHWAHMPEPTVH